MRNFIQEILDKVNLLYYNKTKNVRSLIKKLALGTMVPLHCESTKIVQNFMGEKLDI